MRNIAWILLFPLFAAIFSGDLRASNRRAVLIGINQYNSDDAQGSINTQAAFVSRKPLTQGDPRYWHYPDLNGPVADIAIIEGLLKSSDFGFSDRDIVKLLNANATAQGILATLQSELVDHAAAGDVRFVYYSGHGNYVKNLASKEIDKFDQTIVPADNRIGAMDIRDKELSRIFWAAAKKGVVVTFISDSCHSGSLARGPENGRRVRSNDGVRDSRRGVSFKEPVVDDSATIDPQTKKPIDPEEIGVLTLAGAQRNQESIEQKFTDDPTQQVHGALTFALVRALQTEGPHASMDVILDRILDFLYGEHLSQTPVLGGKGRGDRDILGQAVSPSTFTVSVKEVRGKDIVLRGGQAIGIYEGCELVRISRNSAEKAVAITVTNSQSLAESTARISNGAAQIAVGDRFQVTRWVVPPESILRVYVPPVADDSLARSIAQNLAELETDHSLQWVLDPTQDSPTDVLRWNGNTWILEHIGNASASIDLGRSPTATDVRMRLNKESKFFLMLPPTSTLNATIALGSGANDAIDKLTEGHFSDAQYGLFGRLQGSTIQYAWVATDGELLGGGSGSQTGDLAFSLPIRTDWYDMRAAESDQLGASLTNSAIRLASVRAWLKLQGRPGQTVFPYDLVLRKVGSSPSNIRGGKLIEKERYKLYLALKAGFKNNSVRRRWIYVFDINQQGKGTLAFPELGRGNEGNRLPLAKVEEDALAPRQPTIPLYTDKEYDFEISGPFGTDTFILLATDQPIDHPQIFQFEGVQRGLKGGGGNDLENLLSNIGSSEKGINPSKSPGEWSVERLVFQTIPR
jgi:hypothetical protein